MADKPLIVYKALKDGVSPYQHYPWPLPVGGQPGAWVDTKGKPKLCANGVHGYLTADQARSAGNQVFEMEIEGDIVKDKEKAAGQRGRLLRQLSGVRTFTLGDVVAAAAGTVKTAGSVLDRAAAALGVKREAIAQALGPQDVYVVADDATVVRLEYYLEQVTDSAAVESRIRPVAKMTLTLKVA